MIKGWNLLLFIGIIFICVFIGWISLSKMKNKERNQFSRFMFRLNLLSFVLFLLSIGISSIIDGFSYKIAILLGTFFQLAINFLFYGKKNNVGVEISIIDYLIPSIVPGMTLFIGLYPTINDPFFQLLLSILSIINIVVMYLLTLKTKSLTDENRKTPYNAVGFLQILIGFVLLFFLVIFMEQIITLQLYFIGSIVLFGIYFILIWRFLH